MNEPASQSSLRTHPGAFAPPRVDLPSRSWPHFLGIAALAEHRVIGFKNQIPWRIPEDFRWFKQMTVGRVLVMGRRTFESIGRPLPDRTTVVVSRAGFMHSGIRTVRDLNEVRPETEPAPVFLAGGGQLYAAGLSRCSDLFLTRVRVTVEGDAWFPPFEDQFDRVQVLAEEPTFRIEHWTSRRLPSVKSAQHSSKSLPQTV